VLFGCEESKQCWTVAGLQNIISSRLEQFHEVKEVIFDICSKETKEVAGRVALVIWLIWNNRNQWLWNHEKRNATQIGVQAIHMWNEWFELQKCSIRTPENEQVQQQMRWTPPRQGWIKCNVDASIHCEGRITSGGWCFRNDIGQFLRAGTYWKNITYSVLEAEALVLLEAMQVASTMNLEYITFESDSQLVVGALHANHEGVSIFSIIISSIKNLLLLNSNFEVKFVKRQANLVAHQLARAANYWAGRCDFYSIPPCIENQLINDMS
jgi:ribonuclease HI